MIRTIVMIGLFKLLRWYQCHVLHLSTCTNESSSEDLCARWLAEIKSDKKEWIWEPLMLIRYSWMVGYMLVWSVVCLARHSSVIHVRWALVIWGHLVPRVSCVLSPYHLHWFSGTRPWRLLSLFAGNCHEYAAFARCRQPVCCRGEVRPWVTRHLTSKESFKCSS